MFHHLKYSFSFLVFYWSLEVLGSTSEHNGQHRGRHCACQTPYQLPLPVPYAFIQPLPMMSYLPGCNTPCATTETPSTTTDEDNQDMKTTVGPSPIPCHCLQWTPWINGDQNRSDGGDYETLGFLDNVDNGYAGRVSKKLPFPCNNPVKIECRTAQTKKPWHESGDKTKFPSSVQCRTDRGLICEDRNQADGSCQDYEVRLLCWRPCSTMRWSSWSDLDNPSGYCDCEYHSMADHPVRHYEPCPNGGSPMEIECQTTSGVSHFFAGQRKLECNTEVGFACRNKYQSGSCRDYKVRYLCHHP